MSYAEFLDEAPRFDRVALDAEGIDGYCSSTRWALPALESFAPDPEPYALEMESGYAAFTRIRHPHIGRVDLPFDATWGLGCPLVLSEPRLGVPEFRAALQADPVWDAVVLAGLDPDSDLGLHLRWYLPQSFIVAPVSETTRVIASLKGGTDGFLSRRSRKFRTNLRRAAQRGSDAGIRFHRRVLITPAHVDAVYPTVMAIEAKSWKSLRGEGVDSEPMRGFIRRVLQRSAAMGDDVRLLIAERNGEPIGYLHGVVCRSVFRGLQMSYDETCSELSIGNLLQYEMVQWLSEDASVETYDLGSELEYKYAWGERTFKTWTLLVKRR